MFSEERTRAISHYNYEIVFPHLLRTCNRIIHVYVVYEGELSTLDI